ncbi:2-hydroxyglutaryl-CoA dehydratase [Romboutsia weinsteinii]|uniref:2-hydroxyglutaryl-CoA dehydratase n=1 Tax=Romboutsia weinsteinii TaxID=2020949 RepID=A0A371J6T1_9FIRM|nr:2-hydroxyacyl-CoA dehydratase [Romboutsia weinsteinii]RDY28387.1 2-hydroxyglutaryl-CoA dehydratase [Romboutsia weinsteinii]
MSEIYHLGVDIGSTTVKIVVLDGSDNIIYKEYKRHYSDVKKSIKEVLEDVYNKLGDVVIKIIITGSGGIDISKKIGVKFVQEVISSTKAIETYNPGTDVAIELGGEDAKITYLTGGIDQRMNGICAGGTGAFIDQMASLLKTDANGLNELAKDYKVIYPIASRCGVFAKTDIQPLINDGARKSDIAMSIFNAVVVQTVSVLSCGRKIDGKVAFLGGPLYFLSQLREAFKRVLNIEDKDIIFPEDAQLYIAIGAALLAKNEDEVYLKDIINKLNKIESNCIDNNSILDPLFENEDEYKNFIEKHNKDFIEVKEIKDFIGDCFLGIDAGSTTTKAVLINENGDLIYSYYGSNEGNPLKTTIKIMDEVYNKLPVKSKIVSSTVTGYGEGLIKKALKVDHGEIETIAHYKAAKFFNKNVDFILDIGGQDMKCLKIKNGVIDSIILNEACSSGCGSFLETFSHSLSMNIDEFVRAGIYAKSPVDLGSRCTVFMNSRVKQAQKDGASISDISAGLSYSVIKNTLFKVIKIRDINEIGDNIVVQGGTFYNDLVLRSFEKLINKQVTRPSIAGLMGAFGAALIAKENYTKGYKTKLLSKDQLKLINLDSNVERCKGCSNKCLLTVNRCLDGELFVSGNRCEKGEQLLNSTTKVIDSKKENINLFKYRYDRIFKYKSIKNQDAKYGDIGIPRVLNMYEDFPFWFTFFSDLGFRVVLSNRSSKEIYEKGITSIASETVCYPGKLVHGHIENLIEKGVRNIFYPCITNEEKEDYNADNNYNCPVVISYSEVIKNNVEKIRDNNINYINPFISLNAKEKLKERLFKELNKYFENIKKEDISRAVDKGYKEQFDFKEDIRLAGEKAIKELEANNLQGIVLCGRPYHIDPEINHGISELINSLGMAVLTEDSICHMANLKRPLRVVDQWVYHSRLYKAASFVKDRDYLELVQLNSFGCGLDAVTIDQVQEILNETSKIYTVIKIDEGNNLGAAKIRLRSLKAAVKERKLQHKQETDCLSNNNITYERTNKISINDTILVPQMSPIHFQFIEKAVNLSGYNIVVLKENNNEIIDEGLRYVNNDACYPAIIVIGQLISALKSGQYDLSKTSVAITQTGGGCRATNYIGFLRKALRDAGFENIPVISLSVNGIEKNDLIKNISFQLINRLFMATLYGDLLMKVLYRVRPYEKEMGSTNKLYEKWISICLNSLERGSFGEFSHNIKNIIKEFDELEIIDTKKPRVGLVGEILVKFHPIANNNIVDIIEKEGAEAVVPDFINFFLSCSLNSIYKYKYLEGNLSRKIGSEFLIFLINIYQKNYKKELDKSKRFSAPQNIKIVAKNTTSIVSLGNQTGEGWLLTGEMIELINEGVENIICMQPFGCLPNHITGKGPVKELKRVYEKANIVPIDYDPSASEVNQLNRIKLMLSKAFKNM